MRAAGAVVAALALAACEPEIGAGTYYCGEDGFCPPDLACNPDTFTCETPGSFGEFDCPSGSEADEPDDELASAPTLGALPCGYNPIPREGCVPDGDDVDLLQFEVAACTGANPRLDITLMFPVALVELELALVDDTGAIVRTGEPCTPEPNFTGRRWLCIEGAVPDGAYHLRITAGDDGDCDGACRYTHYLLFVRYPTA